MTATHTVCQMLHSLNVGGAEVLAARLARRLKDRYRFVFACLDDLGTLGKQLRDEGFTIEVFDRQPGLDLACARRIGHWQRQQGVELVQAHQYTPFAYAMLARGLSRRPSILFTEHGRFFPDYPRRKRILFNRLVLRRRDRVVGVGESVRQALIHNEGIPARRVEVIYNGVDPSAFQRSGDPDTLRQELGISPTDFVVVQVARLDHLKDHCTAVRTFGRVVPSLPSARLILVGEGPERDKIEAEIRRLHIESNVLLVGLRHDIARFLRAADTFLLTSISEGIPVTLIEAMAAELPIVSTDVGGVAEVVRPGETGLLAPSGDDAALAGALLTLAADPDRRAQFGAEGRRRAETVFSQAKMHAEYARVFEEMLHVSQ